MSPVEPIPHAASVGTNGLNAWTIVLSGELSMVSVADEFEPEPDEPPEVLDEHAAAPAASRTAAEVTVTSFLGPSNLLIICFPVLEKGRSPRCLRGRLTRHVPPPCGSVRTPGAWVAPVTMPGAARSRCQQAAARTGVTWRSGGFSARHL